MTQVVCRHRADAVSPGVHRCGSPKLIGLKLVTEAMCQACHYRDHAPVPLAASCRVHLLPCLHLGPPTEEKPPTVPFGAYSLVLAPNQAVYECAHPLYQRTTEAQCRTCPDYLFPVITPLTPAPIVQEMLDLPPRPQPEGWWKWPNVQEGLRRGASDAIARTPAYPGGYEGRGIVIVGGGKYFVSAYITIRVLRHAGCQLPIQLWHLAGEMTEPMRAILGPFDITCVDADEFAHQHPFRFLDGHWWKGWQLKPYAIAHSPFREVLLLDADCYPTRNPEFLFGWRPYRERGAVFWPDYEASFGLLPTEAWGVFGTAPGWLPMESGQLLIDKQTCWRELQLALWYNAHADLVYHLIWGDKDTFNIAWRRLGTDYSMTRPRCGWDTHTLLQYGPDGRVLFQHRVQDKFRLSGEQFESTMQQSLENQYNPRLVFEDLCFAFLGELHQHWHRSKPCGRQKLDSARS